MSLLKACTLVLGEVFAVYAWGQELDPGEKIGALWCVHSYNLSLGLGSSRWGRGFLMLTVQPDWPAQWTSGSRVVPESWISTFYCLSVCLLVYLFTYLHPRMRTHIQAHPACRSQDNLWESLLSLFHVGPGDQRIRSSGSEAGDFPLWASIFILHLLSKMM